MNQDQPTRNTLTKRAALLVCAKFIAFGMSVLMPLVLVRSLSVPEFGLYKQAFLIISTAMMLLGLQVAASAYYFMPRMPDKKPQVALNVVIFYAVIGATMALLFVAFPQWITILFNSTDLVPSTPLIGLAILLWLVASFLEIVAVADNDVRSASGFIVLSQLTRTALILAAAVAFGSVRALVVAAVVQGLLQCLILFFYLRRRFGRFWHSFDFPLFKKQLANALPFGLGGLAYVVQSDMHNYFISYHFDPAVFAVYAVGCFQLPLFALLLDSVGSVLIPEMARLQLASNRRAIFLLWVNAARNVAFFFVPACAFLLLMRHEFISVLFTDLYKGAVPIFAINIAAMLLNISLSSAVLRSFDECKYFSMKLHILLIPVMWAALWGGIRVWGLVGAIAAFALVQTIDVTITTVRAGQILGLKLKDLRYLTPLLRTFAAAAGASVAVILIRQLLTDPRPVTSLLLCFVSFGSVYLILAFAIGAVTDAEKSDLRNVLSGFYRRARVSSAVQAP
jgi:O-antigen/teichoic acid export membrane protein